jgi:hypothetical protein
LFSLDVDMAAIQRKDYNEDLRMRRI